MKKLLTLTATVAAVSLMMTSASYAGGFGGPRGGKAKTLSFALSGAYQRVQGSVGTSRYTKCRRKCGKPSGKIKLDYGSYQTHETFKTKHGTGGRSESGNYIHGKWKGHGGLVFSGKSFAVGGSAIISGGKKRRPVMPTR